MLTAFYDLAASPPTYDFVGFLVSAERRRIELGEDGLRVIIVPGPDRGFRHDSLPPREPVARLMMRRQIVERMCSLLPSCEGVWVVAREDLDLEGPVFPDGYRGQPARAYGMHCIVAAARAGCYPLKALKPLDLPPRTATITLREAPYWPRRNSCRAAWIEAAETLKAWGWNPVFVPDTAAPDLPMGLAQYPRAAVDLIHRANLYAGAALNLFVNNGPAWMASMMEGCPVVILKMVTADVPAASAEYFQNCGLPVGAQLGRPGHWIAWEDDTTDAILRAIEPRGAVI